MKAHNTTWCAIISAATALALFWPLAEHRAESFLSQVCFFFRATFLRAACVEKHCPLSAAFDYLHEIWLGWVGMVGIGCRQGHISRAGQAYREGFYSSLDKWPFGLSCCISGRDVILVLGSVTVYCITVSTEEAALCPCNISGASAEGQGQYHIILLWWYETLCHLRFWIFIIF